jgi:hypothetical protein
VKKKALPGNTGYKTLAQLLAVPADIYEEDLPVNSVQCKLTQGS